MVGHKDYQNGKIYKIVSNQTDKIYIGSTACPRLCTRLAQHKSNYNQWKRGKYCKMTSFEII